MSVSNTHLFFCITSDCGNTAVAGTMCAECTAWSDVCTCDGSDEPCDHCARYLADQAEYDVWCGVPEPHCTCNRETGLMCDLCAEEYAEPCRGCGMSCQLWTDDMYCRECFVARYGDEFPKAHLPLPPSPEPDYRDPADVRDDIEEITAKLRGTSMTPGQQADWRWLLRNRQEELARIEAEMWEGYDADDLRKMDQQMRMI